MRVPNTVLDCGEEVTRAQDLSTQQLHVRIACEQELIEWREAQIKRLQEECEASKARMFAAAAVLYVKEAL